VEEVGKRSYASNTHPTSKFSIKKKKKKTNKQAETKKGKRQIKLWEYLQLIENKQNNTETTHVTVAPLVTYFWNVTSSCGRR